MAIINYIINNCVLCNYIIQMYYMYYLSYIVYIIQLQLYLIAVFLVITPLQPAYFDQFIIHQFYPCCILNIILMHFKDKQKLWVCIWESLLKDQMLHLSYILQNLSEEVSIEFKAPDSQCFSSLWYCCSASHSLLIQVAQQAKIQLFEREVWEPLQPFQIQEILRRDKVAFRFPNLNIFKLIQQILTEMCTTQAPRSCKDIWLCTGLLVFLYISSVPEMFCFQIYKEYFEKGR